MIEKDIQKQKQNIDLSHLKNGTYFIHLLCNGEVIEKQQVILQK